MLLLMLMIMMTMCMRIRHVQVESEAGGRQVWMRMWTVLLKPGDVESCLEGIITPLRMYLGLSLARRLELFGR